MNARAIRMASTIQRSQFLGFFSLFTSFGTLICCALPSLLVLFGLGAPVASFLSAVPWLVTLSRHKTWVLTISGALIAATSGTCIASHQRFGRWARHPCPMRRRRAHLPTASAAQCFGSRL